MKINDTFNIDIDVEMFNIDIDINVSTNFIW